MTNSQPQDPQALTDGLAAVRDAIEHCRPLLIGTKPGPVAVMVDTATATSDLTSMLLHEAVPSAADEEPGTGEALERATDLAAVARPHLVTGQHVMAGAQAKRPLASEFYLGTAPRRSEQNGCQPHAGSWSISPP